MGTDVRENRVRRMAARQDLRLVKSRRKDPRAVDYGCYALVNHNNATVFGVGATGRYQATLDDVETYLKGGVADD